MNENETKLRLIQKSLYQEKIPYCAVYYIKKEKKIYHMAGVERKPTKETLKHLWGGLSGSTDWHSIKNVLTELRVDVVKTQDIIKLYKEYKL